MKKLILPLVLGCLGCTQLEGTTVVVVRTPKHFVVAADSLWIGVDPASPSHEEHKFLCKIIRFGHIYFVAATVDVDGRQLMAFAAQAMKTSATVAEAAHGLAVKSDEIAKRTAKAPQVAIDGCWGRRCAQAMFFGIESGVPTWVVVNFEQAGNSRQNLKFIPHEIPCLGKCLDMPRSVIVIGQNEAIDHNSRTDPNFIKRYSEQDVARKLVELEEQADPEEVGGPIDVLTLDAEGAHWAYVKGGTCSPEDETKPKKPKSKAERVKPPQMHASATLRATDGKFF